MTLSYGFPLGEGRVSIAASGTYVFNALVDPGTGAGAIERVGEMGQANLGAMPRFRGNLAVTYTRGPFSITPQLNFISAGKQDNRSEEHTSELQSLMRISYAVFCLKKKKKIAYLTIMQKH